MAGHADKKHQKFHLILPVCCRVMVLDVLCGQRKKQLLFMHHPVVVIS